MNIYFVYLGQVNGDKNNILFERKTFFERTMPELVEQLKQLNVHMAQLIRLDENIKENQKPKTEPKEKAW